MIVPVLVTGVNIRTRHHLLLKTIGVFPEETEAFNTVTLLMWTLSLGLVLLSSAEVGLFLLANEKYHPWHEIVKEETKSYLETGNMEVSKMFPSEQPEPASD